MIGLLIAILFGRTELLTPAPVDIAHSYEFVLIRPISALANDAALQIDVSSVISPAAGPFQVPALVLQRYPRGTITAILSQSSGNEVVGLKFSGGVILLRDSVMILLKPDMKLPIGVEFDRLVVSTEYALPKVKIYWNNVGQK